MTFNAKLPDTFEAREALGLVRSNILKGLSVEMVVRDDVWEEGNSLRIVNRADLMGLALVDRPAYPEAELDRMRERLTVRQETARMYPDERHRFWYLL